MSVNETNPSELDLLRQSIIDLESELEKKNDELEGWRLGHNDLMKQIFDLERENEKLRKELGSRIEDHETRLEGSSVLNMSDPKDEQPNDACSADPIERPRMTRIIENLSSIEQNHVTEISETTRPGKSSIDEASQHLAHMYDKAIDAEDIAMKANQEEILCWTLYAQDFRVQLAEIIKNSEGKFGEKKVRSLLYDSISEQLSILRRKRSQDLVLHLREISRDSLRKKTQRAEKLYNLFGKVGLDKIKFIKHIARILFRFTNDQIQELIEYSSREVSLEEHVTEISETLRPGKILPDNISQITSPPADQKEHETTQAKVADSGDDSSKVTADYEDDIDIDFEEIKIFDDSSEDEKSQNETSASSSSSDSDSGSDYDESMEQLHDELSRKEILEAIKNTPPIKIFDDYEDLKIFDNDEPINSRSEGISVQA
ncbi:hypothetical protein RclHR1_00260035 [Rhizophagus clarus]|uniref:Uncharacterized protein n=1 Tax=Rhizophagus clarus TaxID=94130 RepID=A0A2Z6R0F8_9GLOM|nr:hypothetical protein RclHR1_00260035 [Rhizophagus clarus]